MKKTILLLLVFMITNVLSGCLADTTTDRNGKVCPVGTLNKAGCNRTPPNR